MNIIHAPYRQKVTQLRLSAHKLEIELGRHKKPKIERDERFCTHCRTGKVESEEHFLFECPNYKEERELFMTQLAQKNEKCNGDMDGISILKEIFSNEDETVLILFGRYLNKCWEIRNLMCSNFPRPSC